MLTRLLNGRFVTVFGRVHVFQLSILPASATGRLLLMRMLERAQEKKAALDECAFGIDSLIVWRDGWRTSSKPTHGRRRRT